MQHGCLIGSGRSSEVFMLLALFRTGGLDVDWRRLSICGRHSQVE